MTDLHRATQGDRDALRRVVEPWWPRMVRWAVVFCGDAQLAEDSAQEALVRVLRFVDGFDPERPLGPWLKRLVHNSCRDALAAQGRRDQREAPMSDDRPAAPTGVDAAIDLSRASRLALAAFERLSPRQREIVDRVDLQGATPAEVAEALRITPGAVRAQLFAARRTLRLHLIRTADVLPLLREA